MWCRPVVLFVICINLSLHVYGYNGDSNIVQWYVEEQFYSLEKFDLHEPKVILKNDKPLQIILQNYDKSTKTGSCWNTLDETKFQTQIESRQNGGKYDLIIKVSEVTGEMSTQWQCSVWKYWIGLNRYQDFTFIIHIKRNDRVNVNVNRQQLSFNLTDLSEMDYDGFADFWYLDGQIIDLSCERNRQVNQEGNLRLKYYTAKGAMLIETDKFEAGYPINLQKTMNIENNHDSIYCTYISNANIEYTYKTIFKFKANKSNNPLKITVNGLKLVPLQTSSSTDQYQYRFYAGQILSIICGMDKNLLGNLTLRSNSPGLIPEDSIGSQHFSWQSTKTINMKREFNGQSLRCDSKGLETLYSAEILLLLDTTDNTANSNYNEVKDDRDHRINETDDIKNSDLTNGPLINDPNLYYYIAGAVAGIILILSIVLVIVFKRNKSKKSASTPIFANQIAEGKDSGDKLYSHLPLYAELDLASLPQENRKIVNEENPYAEVINPVHQGRNHYTQAANTLYAQVNKRPHV